MAGSKGENAVIDFSGGSRGGAWGPCPLPLFWVKKEEMTEGKKASGAGISNILFC